MHLELSTQRPTGPSQTSAHFTTGLVTIILAVITFGPALIFYRFTVSSHATGLMLTCGLIFLLWLPGIIRVPLEINYTSCLVVTAIFIGTFSAHLVISAFAVDLIIERSIQSYVLLAISLFTALIISGFFQVEQRVFDRAAAITRILFLIFAVLGALRIQATGSSIALSQEKSVFPFTEPSQFALAFSPFLIHAVVSNKRLVMRYLWLLIGLGLAFMLQNLTLVVLTAIAAVLCLPIWQAGVAVLALVPALGGLDLGYYTQRLDLSLQSQSFSSLIYRQGWELAFDALERTRGWGIGFQQLGYVPFQSFSADLVHAAIGVDSNVVDGGFTAAKLISEFGVFGVGLLLAYLFIATRSAIMLRSQIKAGAEPLMPYEVFCHASICGVFLDLFVRGEGYFSGSILLMEASLFFIWRHRRKTLPARARRH